MPRLPGPVLVALFGLLHLQVYHTYGPQHYRCDREPGLLDWAQFTLAHALREADVLDILVEYD